MFSQSFEELAKCIQNMSCGQCEASKCLVYRHILKSIVKKLEEKKQKFSFSKLDLSLSVHMQSALLLPHPNTGHLIMAYFNRAGRAWSPHTLDPLLDENRLGKSIVNFQGSFQKKMVNK